MALGRGFAEATAVVLRETVLRAGALLRMAIEIKEAGTCLKSLALDSLHTGDADHHPRPGELLPQSVIVLHKSSELELVHGCLVGSSSSE